MRMRARKTAKPHMMDGMAAVVEGSRRLTVVVGSKNVR